MLPRILLTLLLTAPITSFAQYVTIGPNGQVLPAGSSVVVVGQGGGPILTTPSVAFGTVPATPGISLSDRAGISNTTPTTAVIPSASETYPVYSPNVPTMAGQPIPEETGETAEKTGRLINDLGPSEYAGAGYAGTPAGPGAPGGAMVASLGEIAAKYKSERPQNVHTYTNADAERLSNMNVRGVNVNPVVAQTQPGTQAQVAGTQTPPPASAQQLAANLRPSPGTPAGTQATASSEGATSQSATNPQISQAQTGKSQDRNRLPASSSLLPLVGVLGLGCGALGLWLRKRFA